MAVKERQERERQERERKAAQEKEEQAKLIAQQESSIIPEK